MKVFQVLAYPQNRALVVMLVAVIWRREYRQKGWKVIRNGVLIRGSLLSAEYEVSHPISISGRVKVLLKPF